MVPVVMIGVLVLASISFYMVSFPQVRPPVLPIDTSQNETQIALEKAVDLGLINWMENGFAPRESRWYNNGSFPPDLNEAKAGARSFISTEINLILQELESQRGYKYIGTPVLEFDFDSAVTTTDLNKRGVRLTVSGLRIINELKDAQGNLSKSENDVHIVISRDYPVWEMYTQSLEWSKLDSGSFSANLQGEFDKKPFQSRACSCNTVSIPIAEKIKEKLTIDWVDIDANVIKPAVRELQQKIGPNFDCNYTVEDNKIENIPTVVSNSTATCDCPGGETGTWIANGQNFNILAAWDTPDIGANDIQYGLYNHVFIPRASTDPTKGFSVVQNLIFEADANPITPPAGNGIAIVQGMTRKVAGLLVVYCEDPSIQIPGEDTFRPLSAKFRMRFAVQKGVKPPDFCTDLANQDICGGGDDSGGGGTLCVPYTQCGSDPNCNRCECLRVNGTDVTVIPEGTVRGGGSDLVASCRALGGDFQCPINVQRKFVCDYTHDQPCFTKKCDIVAGQVVDVCIPIPDKRCDPFCNSCQDNGSGSFVCQPDDRLAGMTCKPDSDASKSKNCFTCQPGGVCSARANLGNIVCSSNSGCQTFCNDTPEQEGRCNVPNQTQVGIVCPSYATGGYDNECRTCGIQNGVLICKSANDTCALGCCSTSDAKWGRCIASGGACCPALKELTVCPTPT